MDTATDTTATTDAAPELAGAPVRMLWHTNAVIALDGDGRALCFTDYANAQETGRAAGVAVLDWTARRGHFQNTADADEALLFVARPFRSTNPDEPRAFRTGARLYAVNRRDGNTGEFIRDRIGGTVDVQEAPTAKGAPLDIWIADDFGDVAGVNPLVTRLAGFRRWYPGAAVIAGSVDGETTSLPRYMDAANLAATWRDAVDEIVRALNRTGNAAAPAVLAAGGLELCDFFVAEAPGAIRIDARTPEGAPADLLAACRAEEAERMRRKLGE